MPNILQSLIPTFGGKTVFVTDQAGNEVFANAKFIRADVRPESKPMEHPVESGATITDHRVLLPIEIELPTILSAGDYKDVYKEIASLYNNGTLLTVQCRAGTFTNQLIQAIPHTEDADQYDAIVMSLKLKQVIIAVTPSVASGTAIGVQPRPVVTPSSPTNSTTTQVGEINGHAPTRPSTVQGQAALAKSVQLVPSRAPFVPF